MSGRPLLVYDGECGFCRRQVARWRDITGDRIEYVTAADARQRDPDLAQEMPATSVVLVTTGGETLTAALCVLLLDDQLLKRLLPRRVRDRISIGPRLHPDTTGRRITRYALNAAGAVVIVASACAFVREMARSQQRAALPGVVVATLDGAETACRVLGGYGLLALVDPLRTVNGYGLFRIMTTERFEIVIEGSDDRITWKEYGHPWKPGDPARRPRFATPHQPRLDWQLWFAGANPERNAYWLRRLGDRLLEGSTPVLDLLSDNPFPDAPPRYVRFVYYKYEFTDPAGKRESGNWWTRERLGALTPPIQGP